MICPENHVLGLSACVPPTIPNFFHQVSKIMSGVQISMRGVKEKKHTPHVSERCLLKRSHRNNHWVAFSASYPLRFSGNRRPKSLRDSYYYKQTIATNDNNIIVIHICRQTYKKASATQHIHIHIHSHIITA